MLRLCKPHDKSHSVQTSLCGVSPRRWNVKQRIRGRPEKPQTAGYQYVMPMSTSLFTSPLASFQLSSHIRSSSCKILLQIHDSYTKSHSVLDPQRPRKKAPATFPPSSPPGTPIITSSYIVPLRFADSDDFPAIREISRVTRHSHLAVYTSSSLT